MTHVRQNLSHGAGPDNLTDSEEWRLNCLMELQCLGDAIDGLVGCALERPNWNTLAQLELERHQVAADRALQELYRLVGAAT
jgi:hypothetical protein